MVSQDIGEAGTVWFYLTQASEYVSFIHTLLLVTVSLNTLGNAILTYNVCLTSCLSVV